MPKQFLRRAGALGDAHADGAARAGVFDGVAQKVQEDLIEPQLVAVDVLIQHVYRIDEKLQLLGLDIGLNDAAQAVGDIREAAQGLVQVHFAAFNAAHVQNVINQADQMVA